MLHFTCDRGACEFRGKPNNGSRRKPDNTITGKLGMAMLFRESESHSTLL